MVLLFSVKNVIMSSDIIPDVTEYWPEVKDDLSKVKWSHATNSEKELNDALTNSTIMMMEADVVIGRLYGENDSVAKRPVMGHPPATESDITLTDFVKRIIMALSDDKSLRKGVKLDFKSIDAAHGGLQTVSELKEQITFPLWVNADIAKGPVLLPSDPVDPDSFLIACNHFVPEATLSIGWTTSQVGKYTKKMVEDMYNILDRNGCVNSGKKITYPSRAILLGDSLEEFQWLLFATSNYKTQSTVTIWGTDPLTEEQQNKLLTFVDAIGKNRIYSDTTAKTLTANSCSKISSTHLLATICSLFILVSSII